MQWSLIAQNTVERSYQCLRQSKGSINFCQMNPGWNQLTILSYEGLHLMGESTGSAVGSVWEQEEACLEKKKKQHGGSHPLCAWREGRIHPWCVVGRMSGKRANIHSSLRTSDTSQCRKAPWWCLIGFLVVLLLSETPVWQSWGRDELPESLLEF